MRDKEVLCREKDAAIRDLKEKVVKVSSLARQLEAQKADLVHQLKVKNVTAQHSMKGTLDSGIPDFNAVFLQKSKCQCRANGSSCGQSCGCSSVKCSNREAEANDGGSNETDNLVAHGTMLLQNAFGVEKPAETNDDCPTKRKALSDIGNTVAKPDAPKPNRRKKWGKSMIQLVPVAPPENVAAAAAPEKPENNEPPKNADNLCPSESDTIPLKLPRAMRSNGSKLLRERNVDQQDESSNKEPASLAPTASSEEKENCRR
ncbi:hypothetical protein GQ457_03G034350 [Hibiscus cannabinus]